MNKYIKLFAVLALIIIPFSCIQEKKQDKTVLSVTNAPLQYFVEAIVGDKFEVNTIIAPGNNPENMDFTPAQLFALNKSLAYFKVGFLEIENQITKKVQQSNGSLKLIETSKNINILKENPHHHHDDVDHNHTDQAHHSHADGDPHTWSSTKNASIIAQNIYNAILEIDKENKSFYEDNYNKLLGEIQHTDSLIRQILETTPSKTFIIYHPALSYFARDYALEQLTIETNGKQPSPMQLKNLIDEAKEKNVQVVFIQEEFDVKNAEIIAKSIHAKTITLDLLNYNWHEEMIKIAKAIARQNE